MGEGEGGAALQRWGTARAWGGGTAAWKSHACRVSVAPRD